MSIRIENNVLLKVLVRGISQLEKLRVVLSRRVSKGCDKGGYL